MLTTVTITLAAVTLTLLAIAMAYVLGWANVAFHVHVDPKVEAIIDALPGANCGGCGFIGCSEYAEAVATGRAKVDLCAPGGADCANHLAELMGVEIGESLPYRAVVCCAADENQRLQRVPYRGEQTCAAANLVSGVQGCTFGCLGLGDCVQVCNYDAIHIVHGLATVDYLKCIGCKACATVCPRNIITMVPFKAERMVVIACSNLDMGPDVKNVCRVGCIGCQACVRKAELISMNGHLPVIDYDRYQSDDHFAAARAKCPQGIIVDVGKPTAKDLAAVADDELPSVVYSLKLS